MRLFTRVRLAHGGKVVVGVAAIPRRNVLRVDGGGDRSGHGEVVGEREREAQVLLLEVNLEVAVIKSQAVCMEWEYLLLML